MYFWICLFIVIVPGFSFFSALLLAICTRSRKTFRMDLWKQFNDLGKMKRRDSTYEVGKVVMQTLNAIQNTAFEEDEILQVKDS